MYLLEETPEAETLRQNVLNLFYSGDEQNIALACQMLEGGGVHPDFQSVLCVVLLHISFPHSLNEKAKELLKPFLNAPEYHFIEHAGYVWSDWEQILEGIEKYNLFHDEFEIAKAVSRMFKEGVKFCYEHKLIPLEELLKSRIDEQGFLILKGFRLDDILPELACLQAKGIYFKGCPLEHITPPTWQNLRIKDLEVEDTVSRQVLKRLCRYFPNYNDTIFLQKAQGLIDFSIVAEQIQALKGNDKIGVWWAHQALVFRRQVRIQNRQLGYYQTCGLAYLQTGQKRLAYLCFEHLLQNYPIEEYDGDCFYYLACYYATFENIPKMIEMLMHCVCRQGKILANRSLRETLANSHYFEAYLQNKDLLELLDAQENLAGKELEAFMAKYIQIDVF